MNGNRTPNGSNGKLGKDWKAMLPTSFEETPYIAIYIKFFYFLSYILKIALLFIGITWNYKKW